MYYIFLCKLQLLYQQGPGVNIPTQRSMVAPRVTKRVSLSIKPPINVEQLQKEGGAQDCSLGCWPINLSFICLVYLIICETIRVMNSTFFLQLQFQRADEWKCCISSPHYRS